jgi:DNA mismatch repair protein MutS
MALVKEYFELTNKYKNEYGEKTILLMQVGSFLEVYGTRNNETREITGSQIADFSRICELNMAEKNICVGKDNVIMAGFIVSIVDKYLRKLQDAGYTVVVYTQDEQTKNTTRSLSGIFSPGTYFESQEDTINSLTNNITCIWIETMESRVKIKNMVKGKFVHVGISNIDIYTGKTSMFQFKESYVNNPTTYDNLERFISIYKPSEVIIISNLPDDEVDDIINYSNIQCNLIHKIPILKSYEREKNQMSIRANNCEKQTYQKEIMERFFENATIDFNIFIQPFYENVFATQSFCFLLDFVFQHNPYLVKKISEPIFENCSDRLILANHSLKQLNIIDDGFHNGKYSSVVKMLNMCITPMGKRKFTYLFLNPTTNSDYLESEYKITDHILNNSYDENYFLLKNKFSEIKDIAKWNRQIFMKKISPKSFFQMYKNLNMIKEIYLIIKDDRILMEYLNKNLLNVDIQLICDNIITFIDKNIDISLCKDIDQIQKFDENFIKKGVNNVLDEKTEILTDSTEKLEAIKDYFNKHIEKYEKKTKASNTEYLKIHETEKNNFSLVGTQRRCKILKTALSEMKGNVIVELEYSDKKIKFDFESYAEKIDLIPCGGSASNYCVENLQIKGLCKNISSIKNNMKDLILQVYMNFVEKCESYNKDLETIIDFVTIIDILYAKSTVAKKYNYCRPTIVEDTDTDKSFVDVVGLRHCLIEHLQNNEIYVTNNISLGKKDDINGLLLYGTNAVGKTSFIRALGISIIMAQSGLYVPATNFRFKPYQYIFTRILGNDNIFKGLSTFAVEMSELRTILRLSDKNSMILGDELCSGTESISATSIFVAGIQQLHQKKCSYIFATHLHEIIKYDEIIELSKELSIKHMSVIYDREKGTLIYDRKLKDGPGDNMYGLEVCKSLYLPEDFLELAHNIRMKYHPESNSILSLKESHFNSKKLLGKCEKCGINMGTEVHHLQHQAYADKNGIIRTNLITSLFDEDIKSISTIGSESNSSFHKNHPANLLTLCEKCHDEIHKKNVQHKKVKTTKGYILHSV